MKYDSALYDDLYNRWVNQFKATDDGLMMSEISRIMRSKLTSLLATAQILADDLDEVSSENAAEMQHLAETIIHATRYISVLLDAAVDSEISNRPGNHGGENALAS